MEKSQELYRQQLLDHYHAPRGWGLAPQADIEQRHDNPVCGDYVIVQLMLNGEAVEDMRFEGYGCVISRAAASLLTDFIKGKETKIIGDLSIDNIEELLGIQLPPARVTCGLLALQAVQAGLRTRQA